MSDVNEAEVPEGMSFKNKLVKGKNYVWDLAKCPVEDEKTTDMLLANNFEPFAICPVAKQANALTAGIGQPQGRMTVEMTIFFKKQRKIYSDGEGKITRGEDIFPAEQV